MAAGEAGTDGIEAGKEGERPGSGKDLLGEQSKELAAGYAEKEDQRRKITIIDDQGSRCSPSRRSRPTWPR
jgi:hypothetical protein